MRKVLISLAVLCFAALAAAPTAVESYLKIDGVKGDSRAPGHDDWFQLASFSWGVHQATAAGARTGPACMAGAGGGTLSFTRKGPASPNLKQLCAQHALVPSLTVEVAGERHLLQNVSFVQCQSQAIGGNDVLESVSLNYGRCATHASSDAALNYSKTGGQAALKYEQKATSSYLKFDDKKASPPNAVLVGLTPIPEAQSLIGLLFNGNGRATLVRRAGGNPQGALEQAFRTKQVIPTLSLTLNSGQKWTFTNVRVSAFTGGVKPGTESLSLNFTRFEGTAAGFQDLSYKE
jgi:type VI secretion system secreted protein Hcp